MPTRWFRLRVVLFAVAIGIGAPGVALAQANSDDSRFSKRVNQGDSIFVTTHTEGLIRGRLVRFTREATVVASERRERTIAFSDVGWIEKRGDPVWNGALIGGALLGFGAWGGSGASCSPNCATQVPGATALGVAIGASAGALIDRMIPGRTLVYGTRAAKRRNIPAVRAPAASPQVHSSLASV